MRVKVLLITTSFIATGLSISACAQSLEDLDAKYGFREDRFGETGFDPAKFKIVAEDRNQRTITATKVGAKTTLFGVPFKELFYFFRDGKLWMVRGLLDSQEEFTFKTIAHQLELQYGPPKYLESPDPTQPGVVHHEYDWVGKRVWLEILRSAGPTKERDILFLVRDKRDGKQPPTDGL